MDILTGLKTLSLTNEANIFKLLIPFVTVLNRCPRKKRFINKASSANIFGIVMASLCLSGCAGIHSSGSETFLSVEPNKICFDHGILDEESDQYSKYDKIDYIKKYLQKNRGKQELDISIDNLLDCLVAKINAENSDDKEKTKAIQGLCVISSC